MAILSFADSYRTAGILPGPDIIRLRQESFCNLRNTFNSDHVIELTRLCFGIPPKESVDWFSEAFKETDPSFSMIDNEQEAAVLASILLLAALEDGVTEAGLAVLTTAACNNRKPLLERLNIISQVKNVLASSSIRECHDYNDITLDTFKSKVDDASFVSAQQSGDFIPIVKLIQSNSVNAINNLANQVSTELETVSQRLVQLEEEVGMLWWCFGGWSRLLERPFSSLDQALAAGMAGMELAELTANSPGPVAVVAILHRQLANGRKAKASTVSIQNMVSNFPPECNDRLNLDSVLKDIPDLCPALTGFRLATEIGHTSWQDAFRKAVGFDAEVSFQPVELAMQIYRETLLVSLLKG